MEHDEREYDSSLYNGDDHRMWCEAVALTLSYGDAIDRYSAAFLWGVNLLPHGAAVSLSVTRSAAGWASV